MYYHPLTCCFVVSQLFSVSRHLGHFKLGLKPAQLYVRLSIIPPSHQSTYVSSEIIRHHVWGAVYYSFKTPIVLFFFPFLLPSCHSVVHYVVRFVSDGCNQSLFVFFYIVFESLFLCSLRVDCLLFASPNTRMLNSYEELLYYASGSRRFIHQSAQPPPGGAYILSSTDRLFRCITTLQCG